MFMIDFILIYVCAGNTIDQIMKVIFFINVIPCKMVYLNVGVPIFKLMNI